MELIYFLRELKQTKYDLNKLQMIVNRAKTDLDKATCSLEELSIRVVKQDIIMELRIEKARKKGYFDAAKLYFTKSAKQLGKRYGTIIAIDFGTTNVHAGVFKNGEVKIIDNE
ncbi:unnamed protein product [Rotaria sp. Silwood1]|nr:unnamed protein product [Rotaria sp. Silwood1]CAF3933466.1 unnamed protein product [Rotaria sp. Silwood1]CAF4931234.1 unnamed protein product [Rotaria sp. Silwood1]CAF5082116.1 unnamed protein product [Rotaria sp. Silwood1]